MLCLGIESTAHTFGIGIIDDKGTILANALDMFTVEKGGMIPNKVAEHHEQVKEYILNKALEQADLKMQDIDLIAFSRSPGLSPCLKVGMEFAKSLAEKHSLPLVGVNHCISHLTIGKLLTKTKDPVYIYVSGVNTQVIALTGNKFRIFGETLDLGLGNALDKFARSADVGFPGGPIIERLAKLGKYIELPYAVKGMDVSFSGIVTKAEQLFKKGENIADICYSLQETCFAMLTEVAERALAHCNKKEIILIGGVAANKRFCEMLDIMCKERGCTFKPVPLAFCGDQGTMIAWQGILEKDKATKSYSVDFDPYERTDAVEVTW